MGKGSRQNYHQDVSAVTAEVYGTTASVLNEAFQPVDSRTEKEKQIDLLRKERSSLYHRLYECRGGTTKAIQNRLARVAVELEKLRENE